MFSYFAVCATYVPAILRLENALYHFCHYTYIQQYLNNIIFEGGDVKQ